MSAGPQLEATVVWLRGLGVALAACDDLEHEVRLGDRRPAAAAAAAAAAREGAQLPIVARTTTPAFGFARVHRRWGGPSGHDRRLTPAEIIRWRQTIQCWRAGATAATAAEPGLPGGTASGEREQLAGLGATAASGAAAAAAADGHHGVSTTTTTTTTTTTDVSDPPMEGPIYFMWGTDGQGHSLKNAASALRPCPRPVVGR
eukprot:COSAG01_NODE_1292_length_10879_cov_20.162338_5_plen_202_part_00